MKTIICFILLLVSIDLFGQRKDLIIEKELPLIVNGTKILNLNMHYLSRATASLDNFCFITIGTKTPKDSVLLVSVLRGNNDTICPRIITHASDSLLKVLINLENRYIKNKQIYNNWVSFWNIEIVCEKKKRKIKCMNEDLDTILEIIQPGMTNSKR